MNDIDEILASGRYTDRRGRQWGVVAFDRGWGRIDHSGYALGGPTFRPSEVRLLIERDQHRDVCPGLRQGGKHPVPVVVNWTREAGYSQFGAHHLGKHHWVSTHVAALGAARALAVDE